VFAGFIIINQNKCEQSIFILNFRYQILINSLIALIKFKYLKLISKMIIIATISSFDVIWLYLNMKISKSTKIQFFLYFYLDKKQLLKFIFNREREREREKSLLIN